MATSHTVLIVEDNESDARILSAMLANSGILSVWARNGKEALQKIGSEIEVIFMDVYLPEMNGYETAQIIKKIPLYSHIPIIFITVADDPESRARAFEAGGVDFISKPYKIEEVNAQVLHNFQHLALIQEQNKTISKLSEELEHRSHLLQLIAHDIRSPLTGLLGIADLLQDESFSLDRKETANFGKILYTTIEQAIETTSNLLDLERLQRSSEIEQREFAFLSLELSSIISIFETTATQKNITIIKNINTSERRIKIDKKLFSNAISNIISNAIKFTKPNGVIEISYNQNDYRDVIIISDTGIGISSKELTTIFQKFTKTHKSGTQGERGSGLGMYIAKECITRLGGSLIINSEVGIGTSVEIIL